MARFDNATNNEAISDTPVLRRGKQPCFASGLMSTNSYLVVAAMVEGLNVPVNSIGIRKLDHDLYRVHATPSFAAFGLPNYKAYRRDSMGYDGARLSKAEVTKLVLTLQEDCNFTVAPIDQIFQVSDRGFDGSTDAL